MRALGWGAILLLMFLSLAAGYEAFIWFYVAIPLSIITLISIWAWLYENYLFKIHKKYLMKNSKWKTYKNYAKSIGYNSFELRHYLNYCLKKNILSTREENLLEIMLMDSDQFDSVSKQEEERVNQNW